MIHVKNRDKTLISGFKFYSHQAKKENEVKNKDESKVNRPKDN